MPTRYRLALVALAVAVAAIVGSFALAAGGNEPSPAEIVRNDSTVETAP